MIPIRSGSMRGCVASRRSAASASATFAAVGSRAWSVAVSRTLRGVKLSTTKVASPSAPRRSAHAASRVSTPALPCAITIAGTRPAASFGRRSVPTTTTRSDASRRASAK